MDPDFDTPHPSVPDLDTIVVNWNTVGLLDDCLRSIVDATPTGMINRIVVVDNGSTDDSVPHLRRHWPQVEVIESPENVGFCRGNNLALRVTDAPVVLLVNTDARLRPDTITTLTGYFAEHPRAGVVGPRLIYGDGGFQRWTAGRLPTLISASAFFLGLDHLPVGRRRGLYLGDDTDEPFRPEWVTSAVMAVRRATLDEIGLLDESIFVYMDDVDLCARAGAADWQIWYAADTTAVHFMNGSAQRAVGRVSPTALRAFNRWFRARHGAVAGLALRGVEVTGFAARTAVHALGALRHRPGAADRCSAHLAHLRLALEPLDA